MMNTHSSKKRQTMKFFKTRNTYMKVLFIKIFFHNNITGILLIELY